MTEYIEREALLAAFGEEPLVWADSDSEIQERADWYRYKGIVEEHPAADVSPVLHGRWVDHGDYVTTAYGSLCVNECSICHKEITIDDADNYCPACGSKMDLEEQV